MRSPPAGVGRGEDIRKEGAIHGGSVCWLEAGMPAGAAFLFWMETVRSSLNRSLFLGLDWFEAQYAHAPTGVSYGTHVDRLVLFMSEAMPHEAKKARRERWSIAGWFRTRT